MSAECLVEFLLIVGGPLMPSSDTPQPTFSESSKHAVLSESERQAAGVEPLTDLLIEAMDGDLDQPHRLGDPIPEQRLGDPPECRVCGGPWPCLSTRVNRALSRD